jgi:hypothetical protein
MNIHQRRDVHVSNNTLVNESLSLTLLLVKYANVVTIDLSEYDRPGGRDRLTQQFKECVHDFGISLGFILHRTNTNTE